MTTSLLVAAWTLRAEAAVAPLASFATFAHASQLAEIFAARETIVDDSPTTNEPPATPPYIS